MDPSPARIFHGFLVHVYNWVAFVDLEVEYMVLAVWKQTVFAWDTKSLYTLSPYVGIFKGGTSIRVINSLEPSHDPAVLIGV